MGTKIRWEGRSLSMIIHQGTWRVRSRSKAFPVDIPTGTSSLVEAKRIAKDRLAALPLKKKGPSGTLADVVAAYREVPKKCSQDSARGNISVLKSVVLHAWQIDDLSQVQISRLNDLWPAYVAARQNLPRPDYSTRREINHAITSAIRQAASVFIPALRPAYRKLGIEIPDDATTIIWPALGRLVPSEVQERDLIRAWIRLRRTDPAMWVAVGLARFAGLRQTEIQFCRGKWARETGGVTYIDLRDREEDGYFSKTGEWYSAPVMSRSLARYMLALKADAPAVVHPEISRWIKYEPQKWLKQFTGKADKPLHRLRGLYADHVKRRTEQAILARSAGLKAASKSLGHTTTKTTERHYTTPDGSR